MTIPRREALALIAAATAAVPVWAQPLAHALAPARMAPGLRMVEGARDHFSRSNGGNSRSTAATWASTGRGAISTGWKRPCGVRWATAST
jgi:hypothetical protein